MSDQQYSTRLREAFAGRRVDPSALSPEERFAEVCAWHFGDRGWGPDLIGWMRECGVKGASRRATKESDRE